MPKLTDSSIKAAKCPPDKDRLELSDAACQGLILRVTKAGSKTFSFKYWSPLGKTVAAHAWLSTRISELAAAESRWPSHRKTIAVDEDPRRLQREKRKAAREQELSFDKFADRYIDEYAKPSKKSWKNDVGYLKPLRKEWGRLPAASITDDDVADLLDLIAENAPVSASRTPIDPSARCSNEDAARQEVRTSRRTRWPDWSAAPRREGRSAIGCSVAMKSEPCGGVSIETACRPSDTSAWRSG